MSLISTEPQSRAALEGHSNSLISQFDTQLEIIVERYLSFFQERRNVEETYVDSLRNLHLKAYVTDTSFDPRIEPTTTRAAWNKVRGNLERESKARQAFVDTLDVDILKPLTALKESLAQTRKRLKEELRTSAEDYANHAENTLSKLGRVYLKKYQDYVRPAEIPRRTPEPSAPNKRIGSRFSSLFRGRRETEDTESDVAEPEEVGALITLVIPILLLNSFPGAVSEDDCRKAVHTLNVLRLRRVEILEDGYENLERTVLTTTIKDTLVNSSFGKHTDLAINTRSEVEKALTGPDTHDLAASFRRALTFATPPITFYRNFRVGGYSDAIFGVTLADYASSRDREDIVPKIIRVCTEEVEKRGLNANKIYSSGSMDSAEVQKLRHRFEQNEKSFSFSPTDDIHSIAMLLKLYLRELPEPLFRLSLQDYRQHGQNKASYTENDFSLLRSKIHGLPEVHKASLGALSQHLSLVASHADGNGMGPQDLASALALHIFGKGEVMQGNVDIRKLARVRFISVIFSNCLVF
ncbi:Rho GTPase activation protein [Lactarius vividus]|nr:Rho GTPase activation protein [Lactarius vividus]